MDIIGYSIGIIGVGYAVYTNWYFARSVKNGPIREIRKLINRMDQEKQRQLAGSSAYSTMDHTQQDLEVLSGNLKSMFKIKE
jgi:hypothetical protein